TPDPSPPAKPGGEGGRSQGQEPGGEGRISQGQVQGPQDSERLSLASADRNGGKRGRQEQAGRVPAAPLTAGEGPGMGELEGGEVPPRPGLMQLLAKMLQERMGQDAGGKERPALAGADRNGGKRGREKQP